jgi:hypothetical protein
MSRSSSKNAFVLIYEKYHSIPGIARNLIIAHDYGMVEHWTVILVFLATVKIFGTHLTSCGAIIIYFHSSPTHGALRREYRLNSGEFLSGERFVDGYDR